jgi:hypothetical protein
VSGCQRERVTTLLSAMTLVRTLTAAGHRVQCSHRAQGRYGLITVQIAMSRPAFLYSPGFADRDFA